MKRQQGIDIRATMCDSKMQCDGGEGLTQGLAWCPHLAPMSWWLASLVEE